MWQHEWLANHPGEFLDTLDLTLVEICRDENARIFCKMSYPVNITHAACLAI